MLKLSTKSRYGSRLMVLLAMHYAKGPLLLRDIASQEEISEGYLEQIVPLLKSANLIHALRGVKGGYSLTRPPEKITLKEIIQALEGSLALVECVDKPRICKRLDQCVMRDIWGDLKKSILQSLDKITLKDMLKKQKKKNKAAGYGVKSQNKK